MKYDMSVHMYAMSVFVCVYSIFGLMTKYSIHIVSVPHFLKII